MEEAHRRSKIGAEQEIEPFEVNPCETQSIEAIGTLTSGIAHDFKNILAAIVGFAELALADIPPQSSARPNLQQVLKASQRARELGIQHLTKKPLRRKELAEVIDPQGSGKTVQQYARKGMPRAASSSLRCCRATQRSLPRPCQHPFAPPTAFCSVHPAV